MLNDNSNDLTNSIIIVFKQDGTHFVSMPSDDNLEFNTNTVKAVANALTVLENPSLILRIVVWIEQKLNVFNLKFIERMFMKH